MSIEASELAVIAVDALGLDAFTAYARLRTYTPGRASFLFEALDSNGEAGRYSVLGYRVRSCEVLPPGIDAIGVQSSLFDPQAEPETFAAALALGAVGFFSSSVASLWNRIRLFEDEGPSGMFATGATVAVFDHHEHTITVAGPAKGRVAERCVWEMKNGPEPGPLATIEPSAQPTTVHADLGDEKFQARAIRAKAFVSELDAFSLARTFTTPIAGAEAFDAYRALRAVRRVEGESSDANQGYYLDFGESPVQARLELFGLGRTFIHQRRHREAGPSMADAMRKLLPHRSAVGAPGVDALRLLRQLEESSRQTWGGSVGFIAPGGAASFVLGDEMVTAQHGSFWCTAGAAVSEATSPLTVADVTRDSVAARLHAIAIAHATADARR